MFLTIVLCRLKLFGVSGTIAGFGTALQYMHCGDRWMVYIPETLGYGSTAQNKIPAYSTIMFDVTLVDYFYPGEGIPDWLQSHTNRRRGLAV